MPNSDFIVGDAGGTSTQWRVVKNGVIQQFETVGYNAYTHSIDKWKADIERIFGDEIDRDIPTYVYGAGIDTQEQKSATTQSLASLFGENVKAENDLLGVARALCGSDSGNVCILGTGANACFYDGKVVNKVGSSLGYILGDEGSGAYLGKKLLQAVFRERLPKDLLDEFQERFDLSAHEAINKLYHDEKPNQFLSSFAPFMLEKKNCPEVYKIVKHSFEDFFEAFYPSSRKAEFPFYFAGSIAYHFSDILREVANAKGIHIKHIIQSPIAGLVLYHQNV